MGQSSKIEWTESTWNPVRGCSRVSEGCRHCYAERLASRFSDVGQPFHQFVRTHTNGEPQWTGKVDLIEEHLKDPIRWRKPRRVFVNSMSDLFHENLSDEAIDRVFAVMALCPQHTFQVLTKRPERMLEWATRTRGNHCVEALNIGRGNVRSGSWIDPLENVWLGVSVEDQKTANERIPLLLSTPAAVRFVSYEPALGPVNFQQSAASYYCDKTVIQEFKPLLGVDWIIVGGESGPGARRFDIAWARNTVAECKEARVSCFIKQVGSVPIERGELWRHEPKLRDRKGGDWTEWPEDIRVRQYPEVR